MALCLRKSKQGLGEETDMRILKGKKIMKTSRQTAVDLLCPSSTDSCGFFFYKVGGVAAVHAKRTSCTSLQLNSTYNHREKAWDQAILMLIGIITGVPGSVGEALSLFIKWLLTTQGNSKLTAYYSFSH